MHSKSITWKIIDGYDRASTIDKLRYIIKPKRNMSNVNASEENIESPSTYANDAYKEFRKKEKEKQKQEDIQ